MKCFMKLQSTANLSPKAGATLHQCDPSDALGPRQRPPIALPLEIKCVHEPDVADVARRPRQGLLRCSAPRQQQRTEAQPREGRLVVRCRPADDVSGTLGEGGGIHHFAVYCAEGPGRPVDRAGAGVRLQVIPDAGGGGDAGGGDDAGGGGGTQGMRGGAPTTK